MSLTLLEIEVLERILRYGFDSQSPIGLAFSGGADSTALGYMLFRYRKEEKLPNPICFLYVRHSLRDPEETLLEEDHVLGISITLGIPLFILDGHWDGLSGGLEEQARDYRYRLFHQLQRRLSLQGIFTAHHKNDQHETMAMEFFSGAGWRSSLGIPEIRRPFFRPLLGIRKDTLLSYLDNLGVGWSQDSSNNSLSIPRNFFRTRILPEVEKAFPSLEKNLDRGRKKSKLLEDWVEHTIRDNPWKCRNPGEVVLGIDHYVNQPPFLRYELLLTGLNFLERHKTSSIFRRFYDSKSTRRRRISYSFLEPVILKDFDKSNRVPPSKFQGYGLIIEIEKEYLVLRDQLEFSQINGYGFVLQEETEEPICGGWIFGSIAWIRYRNLGGRGQEILLPKSTGLLRCKSVLDDDSKNPIPRTKNFSILTNDGAMILTIKTSSFGNFDIKYTNPYKTLHSQMGNAVEKCGVATWMEHSSE